jgi:AcrR family transcriptional regulator
MAMTTPSGAIHGGDPSSDKAARIVDAMRSSVALRGATGSTFDLVAHEAGVSRGLVHYYFGTKERLLVEVVRRECDISEARLDRAVPGVTSADDVIGALVGSYEEYLGEGESLVRLNFELLTLAQRNEEIATELAELGRRTRSHLANLLREKSAAGVIELRADPEAVAACLIVLADGLTVRYLTEPGLDMAELLATAALAARALLS